MLISGLNHCCGLREIAGLSHYEDDGKMKTCESHMADMWLSVYQPVKEYPNGKCNWRFAIFTEARYPDHPTASYTTYGQRFAEFIRKNELGDLVETTGEHQNPNSGNFLRVWVWTVDDEATRRGAQQ